MMKEQLQLNNSDNMQNICIKNEQSSRFTFVSSVMKKSVLAGLASVLIGASSYLLNEASILSFIEQLELLNKPKLPSILLVLFGFMGIYYTTKDFLYNKAQSMSLFTPIKYALYAIAFIPVAYNAKESSGIVEALKYIIHSIM